MGLKINAKKTKIMTVQKYRNIELTIISEAIKKIDSST